MKIKALATVSLLSIGLFGTVLGFNEFKSIKIKEALANMPEVSVPVVTEVIEYKNYTPQLKGVGFIVSGEAVNISNELAGKITRINFESGQSVKKDDILIELDTSQERAEIKRVETNIPAAKSQYERYQKLVKTASIPKEELEQTKAKYFSLLAEVDALNVKIDLKKIKAPFDGFVSLRNINLGEYLSSGSDIVRLENINTMTVKIGVSQKNYLDLKIGQSVDVIAESIKSKIYKGKLSAISPVINPKTGMFSAEITIPNEQKKLRTGMYASVSIGIEEKVNQIIIPQTAIKYALYGQSVFVVYNDKEGLERVNQIFVKTSDLIDEDVVVTEGLDLGQKIVTNGQMKLNNNSLIFESKDETLSDSKIINNL